MRYARYCVIPVFFAVFTGGCGLQDPGIPESDWTLMYYLCADSSLENELFSDFNEIEAADLKFPDVNVLVLIDYYESPLQYNPSLNGTHLYLAHHDPGGINATVFSEELYPSELGLNTVGAELDLSDPGVLLDYMNWCNIEFSAEKTGLIIGSHGSGWYGDKTRLAHDRLQASPIHPVIATDGYSSMTIHQLGETIDQCPVDFIGMDACLMQTMETCWQLRNGAGYIAGHASLEYGEGWPMDDFLKPFSNGVTGTEDVLLNLVAVYSNEYENDPDKGCGTINVLDTSKLPGVMNALDDMCDAIISSTTELTDAHQRRIWLQDMLFDDTMSYPFSIYKYIDLLDAAKRIEQSATPYVDGQADAVIQALDAATVTSWTKGEFENGGAVSITLTYGTTSSSPWYISQNYWEGYEGDNSIDFPQDSKWDNFLRYLWEDWTW